MKTLALATIPIVLVLALSPAQATSLVPVTFSLSAGSHLLPDLKTCDLLVPAGADGGDVLDAAVATGCISGWTYDHFGTARFVTSIDGIAQQTGTFWALYVDEALPGGGTQGIDDIAVVGGENVEFSYVDWFTPFTLGL